MDEQQTTTDEPTDDGLPTDRGLKRRTRPSASPPAPGGCKVAKLCKGRGSVHASSHGLSAGDSRLSGRVDRRPREMDRLRGIARDPCSGGRAGA
jgi:hypothetical protein